MKVHTVLVQHRILPDDHEKIVHLQVQLAGKIETKQLFAL